MKFDKAQAQKLRDQGLSYSEIAKEMSSSKSTVAYNLKAKFAYNSDGSTGIKEYGSPNPITITGNYGPIEVGEPSSVYINRLNTLHALPPGGGQPIVMPFQTYAGVFRAGNNFYLPADQAIQQSRENARAMYNNLIIREPLQARLWASAEQEWHIEPDDKNDPIQVEIASQIQKTIENIPDFLKLRYSLLKSRWFGTYGVQLVYNWLPNKHKLYVKSWSELNGDSLVYKMESDDVGVYVTSTAWYGAKKVETEAGYVGRAHVFQDDDRLKFDEQNRPYYSVGTHERDAVIIMRYDPQASDFLDSRNAGGIVGTGLRSTIYPSWWQMSEVTGNMMDWMERVGTGITLFKFLRNNEASYQAALTLAESQSNQAVVMVPVDETLNGGKPIEGVERIEPSAVGLDNMLKVVQEFFATQIRRFIVGQDSTSQSNNSGLGSKIAEVHESTFGRIVTFDCVDLQETLTRQLVRVIQKWNHPGTDHCPCKFVIDYARPDIEQQIRCAQTLNDMGVELDKDELRSLAGFTRPKTDAEVTSGGKQEQQGGGMGGGLSPNGQGAKFPKSNDGEGWEEDAGEDI